jgi:hypothetical protein
MFMYRHKTAGQNHKIKVADMCRKKCGKVQTFWNDGNKKTEFTKKLWEDKIQVMFPTMQLEIDCLRAC